MEWRQQRFAERALRANEQAALYEKATRPKDRAVITALLETGLRVAEFAGIRADDISRHLLTVTKAKGGKPREIPLSPKAEAAIRELCAMGEGAIGIPIRTIFGIVYRAGKRAGLAHPHPHVLRHTFAVECLRRRMSIGVVRQLLGHANVATTSIYLEMHPEEAHAEFRRLWRRGRKQ